MLYHLKHARVPLTVARSVRSTRAVLVLGSSWNRPSTWPVRSRSTRTCTSSAPRCPSRPRTSGHNIRSVLAASGATLADIVKINYFLRDIRELSDEIAVRKTLFAADKMPAVTAVQVAALGLSGLMMEVDIIAVLADE